MHVLFLINRDGTTNPCHYFDKKCKKYQHHSTNELNRISNIHDIYYNLGLQLLGNLHKIQNKS